LLLWLSSTNPGDPDVKDARTPKWTIKDDSRPTGCNCTGKPILNSLSESK